MVFSSVPLYLDPPNWQQHPNQQVLQGGGGSGGGNDQNQHLIPPPQIPQHQLGISGGGGGGSGGAPPIRPNSMAERARLAKIPAPEAPLKCPRCESTNTKFCYFNNYSLSQPRHFCKTCRRYWTRGGALRNVPVGGGCRRNKRSSGKSSSGGGGGGGGGSSSSKSSLSSPSAMMGGDRIPLHMDLVSTSGVGPNMPGLPSVGGASGMSSFMASLQNIAQLGMGNLGLTFGGGLNAPPLGGFGGPGGGSDHHQLDFPHHQLNNNNSNPNSNHHQQQQVQFPNFLGGFEIPGSSAGAGLYTSSSFQNDHHHQGMDGGDNHHQDHDHDEQGDNGQLQKNCSSSMMSQLAPVKTEVQAAQRLYLAKRFMGMSSSSDHNNNATSNQFWGANIGNNNNNNHNDNNAGGVNNMWTDLSGLNSSSTSHLL